MKRNRHGPAVSNTHLLDDLIIILSEAVGELAVQAVNLRKGDVPGAKQRRCNADERITAAMRLVESMSRSTEETTETPDGEQVASDALFALRIRSLIADKEMITARANDALARGGQWDCDYHAWYQEVDSEIQYLLKANDQAETSERSEV